ncbi:hypothetical protein GCM10027614_53110 [Micromonospora vulcania]
MRDETSALAIRPSLAKRVRFTAVELAPRPEHLPDEIGWVSEIPDGITGVLLATEWLDNVPLDVAVHTGDGWRYLLVDPSSGTETVGGPVDSADLDWLTTWWPAAPGGTGRSNRDAGDVTWPDATSETGSGFRATPTATTPGSRSAEPGTERGQKRSGRSSAEWR